MRRLSVIGTVLALSLSLAPALVAQNAEAGFTSLFDGKSLAGWSLVGGKGEGYGVKDGVLYCAKGGGGKLLTDKQYADFVLRFSGSARRARVMRPTRGWSCRSSTRRPRCRASGAS